MSMFSIIAYPKVPDPDAPALGYWTAGLSESDEVRLHTDPCEAEVLPDVSEVAARLEEYREVIDAAMGLVIIGMGADP